MSENKDIPDFAIESPTGYKIKTELISSWQINFGKSILINFIDGSKYYYQAINEEDIPKLSAFINKIYYMNNEKTQPETKSQRIP